MCMATAGALFAQAAAAEPWSTEPRVGVAAEYASNPLLRGADGRAETHAAALLDLPVRYDGDGVEFAFVPDGRISDSRGYSSLASDYLHVNSDLKFIGERGSAALQAGVARDSSLYAFGNQFNAIGVRRDTASLGGNWIQAVTERSKWELDAAWMHVRYGDAGNLGFLDSYRYLSAGPTYSFAATERDTLNLSANYGHYQALSGLTESKSETLQAGYLRQLSETWSLNASAGYSRSKDSQKIFFGTFYLGSTGTNQNGGVYSASVARKGENLSVSAGLSRALQPTGLAFLSRQDSVTVNLAYTASERWDFSLAGTWQRNVNPLIGSQIAAGPQESTARYTSVQWTANWHWTQQWVASLHLLRIGDRYGPPTISAASSGASLEISRQFLRTDL